MQGAAAENARTGPDEGFVRVGGVGVLAIVAHDAVVEFARVVEVFFEEAGLTVPAEIEFVGPAMTEFARRDYSGAGFEHGYFEALLGEGHAGPTAAGAGADDDGIKLGHDAPGERSRGTR